MTPDISLLLAMILGLSFLGPAEGAAAADPLRALGGTGAAVLVVGAWCRIVSDRAVRAVEERDGEALARAAASTTLVPLAAWATVLFACDWAAFVGQRVPRVWWMAPYVVLFLPLALMVGAGWSALRRAEALAVPGAGGRGAIRRGLARNALVLVPLTALTALHEAVWVLAELGVGPVRRALRVYEAFPDVEALVVLVLSTGLGLVAPAFVRRLVRTRPLPAGPAREAIERQLAALGVRARDLLLWESEGRVLNAMVVGLTPRTRYVVVSDGLLDRLPPAEVLAVVSHEAGHARLHHVPKFLVVGLATMLLFRTLSEVASPVLGPEADLAVSLVSLGFLWFGVLGWLSRRFEREADVYGALHAAALRPDAPDVTLPGAPLPLPAGPAAMIQALDRVAEAARSRRSHRHGSIESRTSFLAAFATDRRVREDFARRTKRLRLGLVGFALLAVGLTVARLPGGLVRGDAALRFEEALDAEKDARADLRAGRADAAARGFAAARDGFEAARAVLPRRPDDRMLRTYAALGAFNAAQLDLRRLARPDAARAGLEATLALARDTAPGVEAALTFLARIDLGRLALRDADPARAVAAARPHLDAAAAVPLQGGARHGLFDARLRLLRAAVALRSPDPAVATQARRDLERQARASGDDDWEELADDAREALAAVPAGR